MLYKVSLRNCQAEEVLISEETYKLITESPVFASKKMVENLRKHSNGYAFYQKNHPQKDGTYLNETLYLHKIIADYFLGEPESEEHKYVMFKNGNKLDCRLENICLATRSEITRNTKKHHSKSGFRGVYREGERFRATLYNKSERIDIGFFETAEEAAVAYNQKSTEIFGRTRSLNKIEESPETESAKDIQKLNKSFRS
jgi:hypothetical protein